MRLMSQTLAINEIFLSIQGESTRAGLPCVMVRLAGCNLRCRWCDTPYAREGGDRMGVAEVLRRVESLGCRRVEVTGGEPLIQPAASELLRRLSGISGLGRFNSGGGLRACGEESEKENDTFYILHGDIITQPIPCPPHTDNEG